MTLMTLQHLLVKTWNMCSNNLNKMDQQRYAF